MWFIVYIYKNMDKFDIFPETSIQYCLNIEYIMQYFSIIVN